MRKIFLLICILLLCLQVLKANPDVNSSEFANWVKEELSSCAKENSKFSFLSNLNETNTDSLLRPPLEHSNGWLYPAGSSIYQYLAWLQPNPSFPCPTTGAPQLHLAQDMENPQGAPVYAIDSGGYILVELCKWLRWWRQLWWRISYPT